MKKIMKKIIALCLIVVMLTGTVITTNAAVNVSGLGALADSYAAKTGTFALNTNSRIFVVANSEPTGDLLQTAQLIHRQFVEASDINMKFVWGATDKAKAGDVILKLDSASGIGDDGYKLDVSGTATVTAADADGLIYGANMLQKYFNYAGGYTATLEGFTAADTPDTKERTVSLDCGRKYLTAEWIKNFIRQMSWMGYNTLQLHFSDDGGFRTDFWDTTCYQKSDSDGDGYTYNPKNDFTWLCGSHVQSWVKDGNAIDSSYKYSNDPDAGRYLTTGELIEICEVAKEYHIDLIPSFDSPAHMDYITWKFEQNYKQDKSYRFIYDGTTYEASSTNGCINYTGRTGGSAPLWPYYTTIDITSGTMSRAFVLALYADIADFFKEYAGSTDFSIGADEVNLDTNNLASGYSFKWGYSKFPDYINSVNQLLNSKGYTMRMYNDFIGTTAYSTNQSFDSNIEIMYWDSPFNPNTGGSGTATRPASYFVNQGRTIYNCIQTNTYYVLRIANTATAKTKYTDARNPLNRQWTFYGTTEKSIYNEWYPNNVSEKGDYDESVENIPASQLGGAYFLIWNDYASVSTEAELWNGAPDRTGTNNGVTYYLFDRMYSNITKMWNSDINKTVKYDDFNNILKKITLKETNVEEGYFPGFKSCSANADLPAAVTISKAMEADHTALKEALAEKLGNDDGKYTASSYAAYEAAYEAAKAVDANEDATAAQITDVINALNNAKAALVDLSELKAALADEANNVKNEDGKYTAGSFLAYENAYDEAEAVCAKTDATATEVANAVSNLKNAVKDLVDRSALGEAIAEGKVSNADGDYTAESYAAYEAAYNTATGVYNNTNVTKEEIAKALNDLQTAKEALIRVDANDKDAANISVQLMAKSFKAGKKVGLRIVTDAGVSSLTVCNENGTPVTLKTCVGKDQKADGKDVKVWLVKFDCPSEKGEHVYSVVVGEAVETVRFTVR